MNYYNDDEENEYIEMYPKLKAAGILLVISGVIALSFALLGTFVDPTLGGGFFINIRSSATLELFSVCATFNLFIGILSLLGGILTIKRKKYQWTLVCALASLPITIILGVIALILIFLSEDDFIY